jgi:hypothetical protein
MDPAGENFEPVDGSDTKIDKRLKVRDKLPKINGLMDTLLSEWHDRSRVLGAS